MTRRGRIASLLGFGFVVSVQGLSSHSPIDLEAFPAYSISFNEHESVLNTSLDALVHPPTDDKAPPRLDSPVQHHVLRTPSGQAFICTVPKDSPTRSTEQQDEEETTRVQDARARQLELERGLEHGLRLLEPMKHRCIYLQQNWFTYSFCYGSQIRQFHAIQVAGSPIPKEDPNNEAYILGKSPEPTSLAPVPPRVKYGSGSLQMKKPELGEDDAASRPRIPSRLGGHQGSIADADHEGRYLVQMYESGTICDKTGLPRTVEVQFHCNTQTIDRIALIRETSICRYVLLIHTPRLCSEPLFLEGSAAQKRSDPPLAIECKPIVETLKSTTTSNQGREQLEHEPVVQSHSQQENNVAELDETHQVEPNSHDDAFEEQPGVVEQALRGEGQDMETVVLVYNTQTGQIESIVQDESELESVLDSDSNSILDQLSREDLDTIAQAANDRQDQHGDQQTGEKMVSVEQLEEMVKLMADTLAGAINDKNRPTSTPEEESSTRSPSLIGDRRSFNEIVRDMSGKSFNEIMRDLSGTEWSIERIKPVQGEDSPLSLSDRNQEKRGPVNEAFERMKRGFEKRYDQVALDDQEQDQGGQPRDEL
ncbi:Yos9p [Sporobolomyces koalae]|uniref:Yos9p n=1 Tax=Sporobolomyces koalae TaxID=500713 RepID=UPI00316EF546